MFQQAYGLVPTVINNRRTRDDVCYEYVLAPVVPDFLFGESHFAGRVGRSSTRRIGPKIR